jgi:16S rRNA (uracil1498-N3)-methyltransferase
MVRIFVPPDHFEGSRLRLPEDTRHYLQRVLRLGPGAEIIVLDGGGAQYQARLVGESTSELTAEILQALPPAAAPSLHLTLYQGLPRGKRWPLILQKATELGVSRIVPVLSARSVVRLDTAEGEGKRERWQKIATEAAEQCRLTTPPEITAPLGWSAALDDWRQTTSPGLLLDETLAGAGEGGLKATLQTLAGASALAAFVGPEGGWSPAEAEAGHRAGLLSVSLGPRILRTETAALAVCVAVMVELGDMG